MVKKTGKKLAAMLKTNMLTWFVVVVGAHQALCFIASPANSCLNNGLSLMSKNQAIDAHRLRGGSTTVDEMKIEALRAIGESLRRGGHGTARRKFKKIRKQSSKADEAKFQVYDCTCAIIGTSVVFDLHDRDSWI
jgi:hypothetical protein